MIIVLLLRQDESRADDRALQHTFIQHLMKVLGNPERRLEKVGEWVEEVYAVLSVMPWSSGRSGGQLEALCEALWAARDRPLKEERILSSLLRPRCDALVSVYCAAALRLQRDHLLRSAPETQGSPSVFVPDNEVLRKLLSLSTLDLSIKVEHYLMFVIMFLGSSGFALYFNWCGSVVSRSVF